MLEFSNVVQHPVHTYLVMFNIGGVSNQANVKF